MVSKSPFKKLREMLKRVKAFLEPRKDLPEGMSLEELESMIRDSDNAIEYLKKGKISIAYGSMTMEDVERLFRIPKTPVFMDFPSWEILIPTTLGKLS